MEMNCALCRTDDKSVVYQFCSVILKQQHCIWVTCMTGEKTCSKNIWSASSTGNPRSAFFHSLKWVDKYHWVQDIRSSDPQDLQKSFNRHKDLYCPSCWCCHALILPLSSRDNLLQHTKLSQSCCLLSEMILSCIFGLCSPLWSAEYCM